MATKVTGEMYESITGQLFEIGRQLRQPNGYPFNAELLKIALQSAIEGRFGNGSKQTFLSVVATTSLAGVKGKYTSDCFVGSRYYYRDSDFDRLLPAKQLDADACVISTLTLSRVWTFAESAAAILGIGAGTDTSLLGKLLIEHDHTMTLTQVEEMVEATERGESTSLRTDGYGNFFFVETGDEKNLVSVGYVGRGDRGWGANVDRLDGGLRWDAGSRILVRNLDALKL